MAKAETANELFARAMQLHRSGAVAEAIELYRKVVERAPRHAAAFNLLGLACFQRGDAASSVPYLQQALALEPNLPSGHYNLGRILQALERHDEARRHYELALTQAPGDAEIHNNLGTVLRALDLKDQAVIHFLRAVALKPDYAEAHFNLGNALAALHRHEEAVVAFNAAIAQNPALAEAHNNLGDALAALRRYPEAAEAFERAIAFNANLAQPHVSRGCVLTELGQHDDALAEFDAAVALKPDDADLCSNRGVALRNLGRYAEATACHEQALLLDPGCAQAQCGLGVICEDLGRYDEALRHYDRAIELQPESDLYKWNKGYLKLALGHLDEGWALIEHRWDAFGRTRRPYPQPRWDGSFVEGSLLIWGEEGLGDQIIYSSMLRDAQRHARSIRVEVEPRLVPLFARSFPGIAVGPLTDELDVGPIAAQESLFSLGARLRPNLRAFGRAEAYLKADAARTAELRARLSRGGRPVIGLSWQSKNAKIGKIKTASLHEFESVLRFPNCRFIDLQYGDTREEREAIHRDLGVQVERLADVDNLNDIDGLAALISACDMVVTVSNTTAHLAGALGRPLWVLVPVGMARLWYWFRNRQDSAWYPDAHVRRQRPGESWADLIARTAPEIAQALANRARS